MIRSLGSGDLGVESLLCEVLCTVYILDNQLRNRIIASIDGSGHFLVVVMATDSKERIKPFSTSVRVPSLGLLYDLFSLCWHAAENG
jgi:predicted NodU family carbamoyl transferase